MLLHDSATQLAVGVKLHYCCMFLIEDTQFYELFAGTSRLTATFRSMLICRLYG